MRILILLAFACSIIVGWLLPQFEIFIKSKPPDEGFQLLLISLVAMLLTPIPLAAYGFIYVKRIYKTNQFPPAGQKVIRDTKVYRGESARLRAHFLLILNFLLLTASIFGAIYFPYTFNKMWVEGKQKSNTQIQWTDIKQ